MPMLVSCEGYFLGLCYFITILSRWVDIDFNKKHKFSDNHATSQKYRREALFYEDCLPFRDELGKAGCDCYRI